MVRVEGGYRLGLRIFFLRPKIQKLPVLSVKAKLRIDSTKQIDVQPSLSVLTKP